MSRAHVIRLGGHSFLPHLSGGLYWPDENTLIASDLHLEHGSSLARRGAHVPPYDTRETLTKLSALIAETKATRLVLLGDNFHSAEAHEELDDDVRAGLRTLTRSTETVWVSGNHDPVPPSHLGGTCLDELVLGHLIFRHIPGPIPERSCEISGHLHPGASLVVRGRRIHTKCIATDGRRLIMPAFGTYTGAMSMRSSALNGLFDEEAGHVYMLGRSAIHRVHMSKVR